MVRFAKAQAASFMASLVDYFITIVSVEILGFWYFAGSGIGTVAGGFVNFSLCRQWVFQSREKARHQQLLQYSIVWAGYLILTSTGVFLLTHYGGINYIISKIVVTLVMAFFYNYPFQKRYVFR
jgi:putative flippase GtrA